MPPRSTQGCHLLLNFRMASRNHSSAVLRRPSWYAVCALSLPLFKPRIKLDTVLPAGALSPQTADNRRYYNASLPQEPPGPSLPTIIDFHFATLIHPLRLLDLVLKQQFFTGTHDQGRLVVESCIGSTLSEGNWRDLTACCLPKQQLLFQILSERRKWQLTVVG